jgi:hypothetical protein
MEDLDKLGISHMMTGMNSTSSPLQISEKLNRGRKGAITHNPPITQGESPTITHHPVSESPTITHHPLGESPIITHWVMMGDSGWLWMIHPLGDGWFTQWVMVGDATHWVMGGWILGAITYFFVPWLNRLTVNWIAA